MPFANSIGMADIAALTMVIVPIKISNSANCLLLLNIIKKEYLNTADSFTKFSCYIRIILLKLKLYEPYWLNSNRLSMELTYNIHSDAIRYDVLVANFQGDMEC